MPDGSLRVFVYGTLKSGQRNHARYCADALAIVAARVTGRLYHLPAGYPMLEVPLRSILAHGTSVPVDDVAEQERWKSNRCALRELVPIEDSSGEWDSIEGELLTFADSDAVLPRLDRLEDFRPGVAASSYHRVLVPLLDGSPPAWTYVAPSGRLPARSRRLVARWP